MTKQYNRDRLDAKHTQSILRLARSAYLLSNNLDTYGSDADEKAEEAFWALAHSFMTPTMHKKLNEMCVKATAAKCIEYGLSVLGLLLKDALRMPKRTPWVLKAADSVRVSIANGCAVELAIDAEIFARKLSAEKAAELRRELTHPRGVAGMNKRTIERLKRLGNKAWILADDEETDGGDAQTDADIAFWDVAHAQMSEGTREELTRRCFRCSSAECIERAFAILKIEWTPPARGVKPS